MLKRFFVSPSTRAFAAIAMLLALTSAPPLAAQSAEETPEVEGVEECTLGDLVMDCIEDDVAWYWECADPDGDGMITHKATECLINAGIHGAICAGDAFLDYVLGRT